MSKKSVELHIKSNDYFGTLATILSLIQQNINNKNIQEDNIKILNNIQRDLIFLQKNYQIVKNK